MLDKALGSAAITGLIVAGCSSIGPNTIPRDRFDYSAALADSWKHQTLLNIVKLRYLDLPVFLDVGQIVSGYSLETAVSANATASSPNAVQGDFGSIGGAMRFIDRPTITYTPLTGDRFLRNMLEPFPPTALFRLVQAGYAPDNLFELTVESFNGLRNRSSRGTGTGSEADPRFLRALQLLREIQDTSGIGMRFEAQSGGPGSTLVFFRPPSLEAIAGHPSEELRQLLGLESADHRFELIYSPYQERPNQLAVRTRSLIQVLTALASFVDVPEQHLTSHAAVSVPPVPSDRPPLLRVHSGDTVPDSAFFAVPFRGSWFWIEDADLRSKSTFVSVMFLFTLTESDEKQTRPVLTIPTS